MADLGALFTIADRVFQLLESPILKGLKDWESAVKNLNKSVSFIKNMLLDVDKKPELSYGEQCWVNELKEVLYEADDLLDEVITIAKKKELRDGAMLSNKVLDKVRHFFSSKNRILVSYNTSKDVKNIQQKLDAIATDRSRYKFNVDSEATRMRREDTCSFLNETNENIVGREDDANALVRMLLDPGVDENVGFVVVVGVGGLGKTTLARLVSNQDSVKSKFEKNLWVCVSDQDGKVLDVQAILGKIIESSNNEKPVNVSTMQSMQTKLRETLENKTYLLVLDDVWTEDPNEWGRLRRYLTIGGRGSRVVVTTRSEKTAEVVLGKGTHSNKFMLKDLSDDDSWRLFKLTAFEREFDQASNPELAKIGKTIVKKCSNVPLAIKVIGTLLYGQTHRWESFEKNRLSEIETTKNPVMPILKLSYNNLEPSVKSCFRYCALFPKDYEMDKQKLISLWEAQGYTNDGEDCFLILLKRCFFQDVKKYDGGGDIVSVKMHDLMHDLAHDVAMDEIVVANSLTNNLQKSIRHLFLAGGECTKNSFSKKSIRSCFMNVRLHSSLVKTLAGNWCSLRTLRLYIPDSESLSESIGSLLHLRYLDLSENWKLKTLPNSLIKLYNLQTLILHGCSGLKGWPPNFCKLVNLRFLDIGQCSMLTFMPLGVGQLTNLRALSDFKVGNLSSSGENVGGQLQDLKYLVNLRGGINITIRKNLESGKENVWDGCLEHTKDLKSVRISLPQMYSEPNCAGIDVEHEFVIENLQPHRNLKQLSLSSYYGSKISRWGSPEGDWATILPNLVKIDFQYCEQLHGLPLLSNLKHLKSLSLFELNSLVYMENNPISYGRVESKESFFPSLEYLSIFNMKKLKGWLRGIKEGDNSSCQQPFPRLSTLKIGSCPVLTYMPPCPRLKSLMVTHSNKMLRIITGENSRNSDLELKVQEIDSVGYLTTLPAVHLTSVKITFDWKVNKLAEIEEVFQCCSSLRSLEIIKCVELKSVSGGLEHLTALESLLLEDIASIEDGEDNDMPWRSLHHNLRSLELKSLFSMEILPKGMKHLTTLENLSIGWCSNLNGLPEWISCLSSLQSLKIDSCPAMRSLPGAIQNLSSLQRLKIHSCPGLVDICQDPSGVDWHKIRHIPHISIFDPRQFGKRMEVWGGNYHLI